MESRFGSALNQRAGKTLRVFSRDRWDEQSHEAVWNGVFRQRRITSQSRFEGAQIERTEQETESFGRADLAGCCTLEQ